MYGKRYWYGKTYTFRDDLNSEQLGACVITESQKDREITIPIISGLFISYNYLLFAAVVVFFAAVVVVVVAAVDAVVALYLNLTSFHRS